MRHLDFLRSPQLCIRAPRISAFRRLDLFGIPWILSSEMSLFNGLRATWGRFYFRAALPRAHASQKGRPPSIRRSAAPKHLAGQKRPGAQKIMAVDRAKGPSGHWDQTNAVFAFWQEIVDLVPVYAKIEAPQGFRGRSIAPPEGARPSTGYGGRRQLGASTELQFAAAAPARAPPLPDRSFWWAHPDRQRPIFCEHLLDKDCLRYILDTSPKRRRSTEQEKS